MRRIGMIPVVSLLCGTLFGAGLAISGMTDTEKVLSFLDVGSLFILSDRYTWNPALLVVMLSALLVTVVGFYIVSRKTVKPALSDVYHTPTRLGIDKPLILGALCFGIGWGLYGYCPGPAISSLVYLRIDTVLFVGAMLVGMLCSGLLKQRFKNL